MRTGSEMKLATMPSRRIDATKRIAPTRKASVTVVEMSTLSLALGTPSRRALAVRIAIVEVVVTLKRHEVPNTA